tara:strand:+ start:14165 stop:15283 length:1119 start_codon:yes stop_codon:yes gene_type:complete
MSTRNRITFDDRGWCSACQWSEEKENIDWGSRQNELKSKLKQIKKKSQGFDCVIPVSGGKDGSYVSHKLKSEYGLNPLCITVRPALSTKIGDKNLLNFINSGYNHIHITPNPKVLNRLNKYGFIEMGFPYYGWLIAIMSAVIRTAANFKIPLIFYGEDGEVEYGGSMKSKDMPFYSIDYMKEIYFEGGYDKVLDKLKNDNDIAGEDLYFFLFPDSKEVKKLGLSFAHWSYFEKWDSYRNYVVAKESCGLLEKENGNKDTFTNFSQNDQLLYSLHTYLMYLKFGFGRATQDVGIEIRRGAMTRDQGLNLVKMYDNFYPVDNIQEYLEYYEMSLEEFNSILGKYANKNLFQKINNQWQPKFTVGEDYFYEDRNS